LFLFFKFALPQAFKARIKIKQDDRKLAIDIL
jgi:hypothetical protein